MLTFLAETGFDSNVTLAPAGATTSGGGTGGMMGAGAKSGEGLYGLAASALYRPSGPNGAYLRGAGFLRQQFRLGAYDLGGVEAAAGWQLARGGSGLLAEYAYAFRSSAGPRTCRLTGSRAPGGWPPPD